MSPVTTVCIANVAPCLRYQLERRAPALSKGVETPAYGEWRLAMTPAMRPGGVTGLTDAGKCSAGGLAVRVN